MLIGVNEAPSLEPATLAAVVSLKQPRAVTFRPRDGGGGGGGGLGGVGTPAGGGLGIGVVVTAPMALMLKRLKAPDPPQV